VQHTLNQVLGTNLPVDGVMGPDTRDAVRQFQQRQGLPVDGILGPQTERALADARARPAAPPQNGGSAPPQNGGGAAPPTDQQELGAAGWQGEVSRSSSAYVRWVQESLNRILGLRLAVDGISGPQTRSAVRSFQQRAGLTADGIVGPQTEAALVAAGAGRPPAGGTTPGRTGPLAAVDTALPASGPGFYSTVSSDRRYGVAQTIRALQAIGAAWQQAYPGGPRIGIGDLSFRGGGSMPPHKSHDKGLDVDIRLPRNDGQEAPTRYQDPSYSRTHTQELVNGIIANGVLRVQYIFFNDPAVTSVRPWPGHDNHLHVRFYAP
jgi:peptidoglycan hydrolase-like protein with peptidoglycan-binding domain